ncbi:MAG: class A beta-lactamase-related serine hydrolase, partial [Clostridia bacterium]|nr:class A beta-lactamase-related serine hydrolase [Clostridia bacterium]
MELIRVNSPEEMGLSSLALEDFIKDYKKLGFATVSLIRDGKRFTLNSKPYREDAPFVLFSLSKSFTSMAAGFAVAEGKIGWDSRVTEVLSDCLPEDYDRKLDEVTLHHLLSMSSGLDPKSDGPDLRMNSNIAREILSHAVIHAPGTVFHYNTMGTYLAGRMV